LAVVSEWVLLSQNIEIPTPTLGNNWTLCIRSQRPRVDGNAITKSLCWVSLNQMASMSQHCCQQKSLWHFFHDTCYVHARLGHPVHPTADAIAILQSWQNGRSLVKASKSQPAPWAAAGHYVFAVIASWITFCKLIAGAALMPSANAPPRICGCGSHRL